MNLKRIYHKYNSAFKKETVILALEYGYSAADTASLVLAVSLLYK